MLFLKLACMFVITCASYASSQHDSDSAGPCDYAAVMKVVEKLERRVEALEAENAEQRSELIELKAAMPLKQEHQQKPPAEKNDVLVANCDDNADRRSQNRIQRADPELTIAFYSALTTEVHHLGHSQNVPFDNVVTNVGNAYDAHVGAFRAPVAGVYVFSTTILTYVRDSTHYAFALNGHPITTLYLNGAEAANVADSQTIILLLKIGDDVSVQHTESDKSLHGGNHSVFSGFLLSMTGEGPSSIVG